VACGGGWAGGKFRMSRNTTFPNHPSHLKEHYKSQMELVTMTDQAQSEILENNPIGKGLDAFRTSFNSICEDRSISCTPDALGQLAQEGTTVWRLFEYLLPV